MVLTDPDYIRQRFQPLPGDPLYLCLSDLREALQQYATSDDLKILDYGCGGSPYQGLFPNAKYLRADIEGSEQVDYYLNSDSTCPAPEAAFDIVLSTQVLEHVANPDVYLRECYRLLKPSGRLLLSTHGTFEDHGCPHDYYRWTADGLRLQVERSGFMVCEQWKVTSGPRAALFLLERYLPFISTSRKTLLGIAIWLLRKVKPETFHKAIDQVFERYRVCKAEEQRTSLYICLLIEAVKPK